jgi:hypothetical protein
MLKITAEKVNWISLVTLLYLCRFKWQNIIDTNMGLLPKGEKNEIRSYSTVVIQWLFALSRGLRLLQKKGIENLAVLFEVSGRSLIRSSIPEGEAIKEKGVSESLWR